MKAIPFEDVFPDAELDGLFAAPRVAGAPRAPSPAKPAGRSTTGPGDWFWLLWAAGAFVPLLAGLLLIATKNAHSLGIAPLIFGGGFCLANLAFAAVTHGYSRGALVELGKVVAVVTGLIGVALVAIALLPLILGLLLIVGLLAGAAGSGD